jgi:hypothetical protein
MKQLIGKTTVSIQVNEDQSLLKFITSEDEHTIYATDADCCSETWRADIIFTGYYGYSNKVFPFVVESEEYIQMPAWADKIVNSDGRTRQESDAVYGHKLGTSEGIIEIIYRNSSNGYYGGSYDLVDIENHYLAEQVNKAEWDSVTGDWTASNGNQEEDGEQ